MQTPKLYHQGFTPTRCSQLKKNPHSDLRKTIKSRIIYIPFLVPDSPYHWYVAEGSPVDNDFVFFGFHMGSELEEGWNWTKFRLSDLEAFGSGGGAVIVRDPEFKVGRFTDVVPHPYLNRDFNHE